MSTVLQRATQSYRDNGLLHVVGAAFRYFKQQAGRLLFFCFFKLFRSRRVFFVDGKGFRYRFSWYNSTWSNERAVEIPLIWDIVQSHRGKRVLEVGNVLSHYFPIVHDVLDKYERSAGVLNEDVVDFCPDQKYDLIVSISTLEHVGWDEEPVEPEKVIKAIEQLRTKMNKNATFVFTVPLAYHTTLDKHIRQKTLNLSRMVFMKRTTRDNQWVEATLAEVQNLKFNDPYPYASSIMIGFVETKD